MVNANTENGSQTKKRSYGKPSIVISNRKEIASVRLRNQTKSTEIRPACRPDKSEE